MILKYIKRLDLLNKLYKSNKEKVTTMVETRLNPDGEPEEVIWVDIKGWEGIYAVNQFGDIKTISRFVKLKSGLQRCIKETIRKPNLSKGDAACMVYLSVADKNSNYRRIRYNVGRLVAEAFLGLKRNNRNHLITYIDNNPANVYYKNISVDMRNFDGLLPTKKRPIIVIFEDGSKAKYDSIIQASQRLGFDVATIGRRLKLNGEVVNGFGCRTMIEEDEDLQLPSTVMTDELWAKKLRITGDTQFKLNPDGEMEEVIWVDVRGWEGLYAVNQFGEVKSYSRMISRGRGETPVYVRGRILSLCHCKNNIVTKACFAYDNVRYFPNIRRLVAEAFLNIDREDSSIFITNHDGDRSNNYYKNLKPIDSQEFFEQRNKGTLKPSISKQVVCENKDGEKLVFKSINDAIAHFAIKDKGSVTRWVKNPDKFYRGWKWSYGELADHQRRSMDERDKAVIDALMCGMSHRKIRELYHVSNSLISRLKMKTIQLKGDDCDSN